jgi:hypothetical protein
MSISNIIKFNVQEDFGTDFYVQILNTGKHLPKFIRNRSLLQVSISWNDYSGFPYLQITSGGNGFLSILFWVGKFGFDVDILSSTWNWDYLKDCKEYEELPN